MQFRSKNSKNYQKYSIYIRKSPVSVYSRHLRLHNICPETTSKDMIKKCVPSYASRQFNSIQIKFHPDKIGGIVQCVVGWAFCNFSTKLNNRIDWPPFIILVPNQTTG